MNAIAEEHNLWVPSTEEEKEMVRKQMNRLLETSHFKNSKRYPALFRFIVEETLDGRGEFLKERLLGVHVFDRPADYDTATDPIVRVTIAEIRKRIAQYYHEDAHQAEMRIELLPGHYAPEFRPRHDPAPLQVPLPAAMPDSIEHAATLAKPAKWAGGLTRAWRYVVAIALILAIAGSGLVWWRLQHPSALAQFWQPILSANRTVMFCIPKANTMLPGDTPFAADGSIKERSSGSQPGNATVKSFLDQESFGEIVVFSDVLATLKITNFLTTQNHDARYRLSTVMTLDDLRQGPGILIGGLDNQWTLRTLAPLRFRFFGGGKGDFWIFDAKNPQSRDWQLKLDVPYSAVRRDYAIVARVHDQYTGQVEVIVAGIGMSATAAAGEMLVDPQQLEELRRLVGPGFRDHDFEAVLSTEVVNGIAGTPKIVAVSVQ
jgi:hypothetical protein